MDYRQRTSGENESALERLAQLPFGLILFIIMIIALSYYFDGRTSQAKSAPGAVTQIDNSR
jgi:hypothetical protein